MPKVEATGDEEGERSSKRRRTEEPPPQQQHLYLILDDWKLGYSIRKIDVSSGGDPIDLLLPNVVAAVRLPPPIFRLKARRELPMFFTTALGSRIVAMHPQEEEGGNLNCGGAFFDVHTACLNFIPRPDRHAGEFNPIPIYFFFGNKLLALGSHSLQLLDLPPMDDDPSCDLDSFSWRSLPDAPFGTVDVLSYAALHEEQTITIFVSVGLATENATYSFQMADHGSSRSPAVWRYNGEWTLPFYGHGYFVLSLNAWVGLSMYWLETGHVCACDLVSSAASSADHGRRRPAWRFSKEELFSDDPTETHVSATLVYTGRGSSRFCLLECVIIYYKYRSRPYNFMEKDVHPQAFRYLYRVTTFSLRYDENGDLTTGESRRVRYYEAPKGDVTRFVCKNPVVFWM